MIATLSIKIPFLTITLFPFSISIHKTRFKIRNARSIFPFMDSNNCLRIYTKNLQKHYNRDACSHIKRVIISLIQAVNHALDIPERM